MRRIFVRLVTIGRMQLNGEQATGVHELVRDEFPVVPSE